MITKFDRKQLGARCNLESLTFPATTDKGLPLGVLKGETHSTEGMNGWLDPSRLARRAWILL
jgi:hypothetical protein